MTKQPHKGAGGYDRRAIMRKAHREYAASRRRGDGLTFGYWLAYAWRVARDRRRRDMTGDTMRRIAGMIEEDIARQIALAPATGRNMGNETHHLGIYLSCADNRRRMADERGAIC